MRIKLIAGGLVVVLAGVAWWIWPRDAGDPARVPGSAVTSSDQAVTSSNQAPTPADGVGEPMLESYNTLAQLLAGTPDTSTLSVDERKKRMRGLFDAVRSVNQVIPRDTFDLNAVIEQAGREPAKLHAWVRTHTTWVPYRGALRGAPGTLMDRTGNSLDRSLLLARLLRASGVTARLARASLSGDQATSLQAQNVQTAVAIAPADSAALRAGAGTALDTYATQVGLDTASIRQQVQQTEALSRRASEDVQQRVTAQTARLVQDLGLASAAAIETSAADLEALRDHWWVQAQTGDQWTDLDAALADAGRNVVPAQETMDPDAFPADLHHSIQVRIIVEQWNGTAYQEQRPVSIDLRPSEVVGEILRLQHVPLAWPMDQIATPSPDPQRRLKETALAQQEWLPVFTLGAKRVSQASVMATGDLNAQPGTKKRGPVGGYVDLFGGGSNPDAGQAPARVLTAEWIEYEIRVPGRAPRIIRREVFDIVGGAARAAHQGPTALTDQLRLTRALSLVSETEILLMACQPSAAFTTYLMASRLLENEPLLSSLVSSGPPPEGQALLDQLRGVKPLPGTLHALAIARDAWSRAPGTMQLRQPNVLSHHTFLRQDAAGQVGMASAFDIVANDVTPSRGASTNPFMARVEQGVLDANVEAALIGSGANGGTTAARYGASETVPGWVPVRSMLDLEKMEPQADLRARLEADLRNGFVLLVAPSTSKAPPTWWRVDPRTGDTLSVGDRGWGQAAVEYKAIVAALGVTGACFLGASADGSINRREGLICLGAGVSVLGVGFAFIPGWGIFAGIMGFAGGWGLGAGFR